MQYFINLKLGNISMKKYSLNLTQLARYSSTMVADSRAKISKFVSGVSKDIVKKYMKPSLIKDMDLSTLMVLAQQIEKEELKETERENKRARTCNVNFCQ